MRMDRFARPIAFLLLMLSTNLTAIGQEDPVVVEVTTNAEMADVFVDGLLVGQVTSRLFAISPDAREVRLVTAGGYSWSVPPISRKLDGLLPGDTLQIRMDFPYYYRLESTPGGAEVSIHRGGSSSSLGYTPTTFEAHEPLAGTLEFRLEGFQPSTVVAGDEIWNIHAVDLAMLNAYDDVSQIALSPPSSRRKWIDYAAVGTALVAGALAVHFKFEADRRFDRYQDTGDPDLRPGIKRYDVYSGVALGVMQAGVGLFAIRLVLR